jgi:hypothetical protein
MKELESNLKLYVQPETEVVELEYQTCLLGNSGGSQEACEGNDCPDDECPLDVPVCEGCFDD